MWLALLKQCLSQVEMVRDNNKEKGIARCTIKGDIMKAYDSIHYV